MKIFYGSDLHLEHERRDSHTIENIPSGDLLILAGDVFSPWMNNLGPAAVFFEQVSEKFKQVVYVAGNHEHYQGFFTDTHAEIEKFLSPFDNIHLLNGEAIDYEGFSLFGCTLWTDARGRHPEVMWDMTQGMNDYDIVHFSQDTNGYYGSRPVKLRPDDTVNENDYHRQLLRSFLERCAERQVKPVIVTHHAPSWECVEPEYRLDNLSYAYANTGLDSLLADAGEFIWIHGHMHKRDSIDLFDGVVLCNARGYISEAPSSWFKFKELTV